MDREKINTSQFELKPEGHYVFTVTEKPEKRNTAKSTMRIWRFTHEESGMTKKFSTVMFPWTSRELLLAVGGESTGKNSIDIDWDIVAGKIIECDIIHEEDNDGNMREVLTEIEPINYPSHETTPNDGTATLEEEAEW